MAGHRESSTLPQPQATDCSTAEGRLCPLLNPEVPNYIAVAGSAQLLNTSETTACGLEPKDPQARCSLWATGGWPQMARKHLFILYTYITGVGEGKCIQLMLLRFALPGAKQKMLILISGITVRIGHDRQQS